MRIVLIGPLPPLRGGIAAHTAGFARALRTAGHDVSVLAYRRLYPRTIASGGEIPRSAKEYLGSALIDTMRPSTWRHARRWLLAQQPEIVIVQWWNPITAPALRTVLQQLQQRVVVVCHNHRPHEAFPGWKLLRWSLLRRADGFMCHSAAVADALRCAGYRQPRAVTAMPLLIAAGRGRSSRVGLRQRLGLDAASPVALFLGHLRAYKGVDLLLEAWSRAILPGGSHLIIAGERRGWLSACSGRVVSSAYRNSVTVIDRFVDDREFCELLESSDVLVLPYRCASQSGALPMGLACGLRVVVSDAGGLSEALPAGSTHEIFPAGNVRSLSSALEREMCAAAGHAGAGASRPPVRSTLSASAVDASWLPAVYGFESLPDRLLPGRRRYVEAVTDEHVGAKPCVHGPSAGVRRRYAYGPGKSRVRIPATAASDTGAPAEL